MRKAVHNISLLLAILLCIPIFFQTAHVLANHHEKASIKKIEGVLVVSTPTLQCDICDFEYTSFIQSFQIVLSQAPFNFVDRVVPCENQFYNFFNGKLNSLRGPPVNFST